jgi:hypothetical protein
MERVPHSGILLDLSTEGAPEPGAAGSFVVRVVRGRGAPSPRRLGCGGIWDGGVMSWRATDLAEDDARQQAADLNVTFNQYGQRDQADRREVSPPIEVESATWSAAGDLDYLVKERRSGRARYGVQTDITCGSELLIFVRPMSTDCGELLLSFVVSVSEIYRRGSKDRRLDCFRFAASEREFGPDRRRKVASQRPPDRFIRPFGVGGSRMSQQSRRHDSYPWTWEIPLGVVLVILMLPGLRGASGARHRQCAGRADWAFPSRVELFRSLPAVLAGDAAAGLMASTGLCHRLQRCGCGSSRRR